MVDLLIFKDKEGGLVVDYVGIAAALKQAMNDYTARDKKTTARQMSARLRAPSSLKSCLCAEICFMDPPEEMEDAVQTVMS